LGVLLNAVEGPKLNQFEASYLGKMVAVGIWKFNFHEDDFALQEAMILEYMQERHPDKSIDKFQTKQIIDYAKDMIEMNEYEPFVDEVISRIIYVFEKANNRFKTTLTAEEKEFINFKNRHLRDLTLFDE
tara:strand:- start:262 stop:651 length:390 start_codon:yes stop_codon:yes gene_type:complete